MFIIFFIGLIILLSAQDYFSLGDWWFPVYFAILLIIFFIKEYLKDKDLINNH